MRDRPSGARVALLVAVSIAAFAGNSILCRLALRDGSIDPAAFTAIRLLAGAIVLVLLMQRGDRVGNDAGDWLSAACLFVYAAGFSFAYVKLPAGLGALLLFGAVQGCMFAWGFVRGERAGIRQLACLLVTLGGLVGLLRLPGAGDTFDLAACALMLLAGIAWGAYSLRGRAVVDAIGASRGNFVRAAVPGLVLLALCYAGIRATAWGIGLAVLSGAVTSALGYVVWYSTTPFLSVMRTASVQLATPVVAAVVGVLFLGERLSLAQWLSGAAILAGIGFGAWSPAGGTKRIR